jgi:hypothetical protein
MVGRFPWRETGLAFYEAKDASGSHLWYAVSNNFARGLGSYVRSDTVGTITVEDRSGAILHDGTGTSGAAAVIIAPGTPIDRAGVLQDRSAGPNRNDPVNYLDLFGTIDNADFNNADDGFVTGPIYGPNDGSLAVNDQMIVITAAEVVAMAEKATLQAYRDAILDYLNNTGGVYPWLYNYRDVTTVAELNSYYPAFANFDDERDPDPDPDPDTGYLDNYGRIPSIFARYFTRTGSEPFETTLLGTLTIDYGALGPVGTTASGNLQFNNGVQVLEFPIPGVLTDVQFVDLGAPNGRLKATLPATPPFVHVLYFWDEDDGSAPVQPTGFWTVCPDDGNGISELTDCHRDAALNPTPGGSNDAREEILRVALRIDLPAGTVNFDADYSTPPTIAITAANADSHAIIEGSFAASDLVLGPVPATAPTISASYQIDRHYHEGDAIDFTELGDLTLNDLLPGATLRLAVRYFPELPAWAFANDWHNSIRMAYADNYLPPLAIDCEPNPDADPSNDCLTLPEELGAPRNIASLLVIAGEHDWDDNDANGMADDLRDVFDNGNNNNNRSFYNRRSISPLNADRGNDKLLVIEER